MTVVQYVKRTSRPESKYIAYSSKEGDGTNAVASIKDFISKYGDRIAFENGIFAMPDGTVNINQHIKDII